MGKTLTEISQELKDKNKKVQLIYAFNGGGKTRLSREFKKVIDVGEQANRKILYYNAFTEDLFYWRNGSQEDPVPKFKIHPNDFTKWIFEEQGQDANVIQTFQHYTNEKLTPKFNQDFSEVTFSYERGHEGDLENIKISKGEESNFVWSVFYSLITQVTAVLNESEKENRETNQFDDLEYIFIDDPVTSLDDNHLIQLAVDLAGTIKRSSSNLKFVISTHNINFYNVIYNETKQQNGYILNRLEDNTFELNEVKGDSNKNLSYHLYLKSELQAAVSGNRVKRQHFTYLRNLYEKTASFLGYQNWGDLLPGDKDAYYKRISNFTSHSTLPDAVIAEPTPQEKATVKLLLEHLIDTYSFWKEV